MSLISSYKVNKAINTLVEETNASGEKYKKALQILRNAQTEIVIPKLIEATVLAKNQPLLESLLQNMLKF